MAKRKNADEEFMENGYNKKYLMDLNKSYDDQHFVLTKEIVENTILTDLSQKNWRVGKPIGKGSFGEIFLASDNTSKPVTSDNAKYVVKIEPHLNGPLFVEIHCLLKTGKATEDTPLPLGMPEYIASGSHIFGETKYRFLVLKRYKYDLHSIIKNHRLDPKCVLIIASQIIDILEHFHSKGYAHSDIKAENLMIDSCTYNKVKINRKSAASNNINMSNNRQISPEKIDKTKKSEIEFSGTQPMRSCRSNRKTSTYDDMLKTHYLRPVKKINYSEEYLGDGFYGDYFLESNHNGTQTRTQHNHNTNNNIINNNLSNSKSNNNLHTEDRIFLIDFGLASKFIDANGQHRSFCMDQRSAHDGTLEFTSRDAHMGAHARRSDLECLGYNLIYWCQGTLPWKDEKLLQQPEQVHRMKEYFMTDVKFMLQQIYGRDVPKFLGEYMKYVGNLAYDEQPDYKHCKYIFEKAFIGMGYNLKNMTLKIDELKNSVKKIKNEKNESLLKQYRDIKSIMNFGMALPFNKAFVTPNKVSPKNLRSKNDKLKNNKFSWTEILNADPDLIARQRAEKEFEREQSLTPTTPRYTGNPTYAIIELENKLKSKDKNEHKYDIDNLNDRSILIKGYTKPMMDVLRKRQIHLFEEIEKQKNNNDSNDDMVIRRNRLGLRNNITLTKRSLSYKQSMENRKNKRKKYTNRSNEYDRSSCDVLDYNDESLSSINSNATSRVSHSSRSTSTINSRNNYVIEEEDDENDKISIIEVSDSEDHSDNCSEYEESCEEDEESDDEEEEEEDEDEEIEEVDEVENSDDDDEDCENQNNYTNGDIYTPVRRKLKQNSKITISYNTRRLRSKNLRKSSVQKGLTRNDQTKKIRAYTRG